MQNGTLDISIEYCAPCGYSPKAVALTEEVMSIRDVEFHIKSWMLIPSSGGCFELVVNGETVFSKKALKRHPEPGECLALIQERVPKLMP
jgi:selenoprotein W-related protein